MVLRPGKRRRLDEKRREHNAAKKLAQQAAAKGLSIIAVPSITEDDLLSFQQSHFGVDEKPDVWFVDAETALAYDPVDDDDGLGYYADGVKRTLTDEQVAMFRHTEVEMLRREEERRKVAEQDGKAAQKGEHTNVKTENASPKDAGHGDTTAMEEREPETQRAEHIERRSESTTSVDPAKRKREQEVPYDERHKREWEDFIEENDPEHGSMTHRRLARELDMQKDEHIELDY